MSVSDVKSSLSNLIFGLLFLLPVTGYARVFDFGSESFASYLLLTGGTSVIQDSPFAMESTAVTQSGAVAQNISGEFGFIYTTKTVSWRFGFEVLKPALATSEAQNAGGTTLYSVSSNILGYLPKLGLEINFKTAPTWRAFVFGYAGQTSVTVTNTYTAGSTTPAASTLKYKGNCNGMGGGLGFEFFAFDTTTMLLEVGYRKMNIDKMVYAEAATDLQGTARAAGDDVLRTDGDPRGIDFTGAYAGLGFRWYLL